MVAACKDATAEAEACVCVHRPPRMKPQLKRLMMLMKTLNEVESVSDKEAAEALEQDMEEEEDLERKKVRFMNLCGKCEDPCALRLLPERREGARDAAREMSKVGMQLMEMLMKELAGSQEDMEQE